MNGNQDRHEAELVNLRRRMRRLTATNIVLAVTVLSFGGASAAYALAAANSVNSAAIIDRTIGTPDVKVGAFAGQTILDNSMTTNDINEATLVPTCKAGLGLSQAGDLCYTPENPALIWNSALDACSAAGLRLPTIAEARLISIDASNDVTQILTDTYEIDNGGNPETLTTNFVSAVPGIGLGTATTYRCVTTVGARF